MTDAARDSRVRNNAAARPTRRSDLAEATIVDAGAARQRTLVGVPVPANRPVAAVDLEKALESTIHEPTLVDTPQSESRKRAHDQLDAASSDEELERSIPLALVTRNQGDADAPPVCEEATEERYVVRAGMVVREPERRSRGALWVLVVLAIACGAAYPFRVRLNQRVRPTLAAAWLTMAGAIRATLDPPPPSLPAIPVSPAQVPVAAAPTNVPALAENPVPVAPIASSLPPHVETTTSTRASARTTPTKKSAAAAHAPLRVSTKPKLAATTSSDNPY